MFRTRVLTATLASLLVLGGCAASGGRGGDHAEAGRTPADALARRAAMEVAGRAPAPIDAPLPPGVDASRLASSDPPSERATRSLADAMADCLARTPPPAPPTERDEPTQARRDEALRHYVDGRDEALRGRHLAAVTELEKARSLDPLSPSVLRALARSYAIVGNPVRAPAVFEELLALEPNDAEARLTLALAAVGRRDFEGGAALVARARAKGYAFDHDPAGELLADYALHVAFQGLGNDRASIEAGRAATRVQFPLEAQTAYRHRLAALFRQRGEILRSIGDAHARLRELEGALAAYAEAAQLPTSDPAGLQARVIYVNLCLGRPYSAQRELLAVLHAAAPTLGERDVRLCEYVVGATEDHELLAAAVLELHEAHPDESGLVRAAALLVEPDRAKSLLHAFVRRRPRDVDVVGQLLPWLAARDTDAAVDLTASLIAAEPDLADAYLDRLVLALSDPVRAIVDTPSRDDASRAQLRARLLARRGALGPAWDRVQSGLERWPDDVGFQRLLLELAARLDEPGLLRDAIERTRDLDDPWTWNVRAAAYRVTGQHDAAIEAAHTAVDAADRADRFRVESRLELARSLAAKAAPMPTNLERRALLVQAAERVDDARAITPDREDTYELLMTLYRPGGPLADVDRFRELLDDLRRNVPGGRLHARLAAQDALERGRHERALEQALALSATDPTDMESLGIAITAWQRLDRVDDAER
jgi:tetratricopeptide (TPR) repeat protein